MDSTTSVPKQYVRETIHYNRIYSTLHSTQISFITHPLQNTFSHILHSREHGAQIPRSQRAHSEFVTGACATIHTPQRVMFSLRTTCSGLRSHHLTTRFVLIPTLERFHEQCEGGGRSHEALLLRNTEQGDGGVLGSMTKCT